jgi:ring-1,2-phenylacetyl-CoA epoxidase subunit PaaC
MQAALDGLWPMALQLFQPMADEEALNEGGLWPSSSRLGEEWQSQALEFLRECELTVPNAGPDGRDRRVHTEHLGRLLEEMQSVARLEPQGEW